MNMNTYAHAFVYVCIITVALGIMCMIGVVYHYINKYVFIPMCERVATWRDDVRAMDTTAARYHKVVR